MTDDDLRDDLFRLEAALARRDPAGLPGALLGLADLLADDFFEFGASGHTWTAAQVREALATESPRGVSTTSP